MKVKPLSQVTLKTNENLKINDNNNIKIHKRSIKNIKKHKRSIKNIKKLSEKDVITNTNDISKTKCIFSKNILIPIIILLTLGVIFTIVFILFKKIKKFNKNTQENLIDNTDIINLEKSYKTSLIQNEETNYIEKPIIITISDISYKQAESIINSNMINENHILLNEIIKHINDSLIICDSDIELISNNSEISYNFPDFLKYPTKGALKIVKSDIDLYKKKYEELLKKLNNFTKNSSESLKQFCSPLNDTKEEITKILYQFEETIKNLSIPFIFKEKGLNISDLNENEALNLRRLSIIDEMEEFKNETDNLNGLYNKLFNYINEEVKIISSEINEIPNTINYLENVISINKKQYENILEEFNQPEDYNKYHENLLQIKASFLSLKDDMTKKKIELIEKENAFENQYNQNKIDIEGIKNNSDIIINNLNSRASSIKNEINNIREVKNVKPICPPDSDVSSIIANSIIKSLDRVVKIICIEKIITEQGIEVFIYEMNVLEKTSLDLLFVMDITGSMSSYLNQAKQNIINIMNKIILECPGIDINLGFIGYRDVYEVTIKNYVDIDFTQNHQNLQDSIKNIIADGGADTPEDVAWALERALDKNWKNNARFIIFVADSPCHGNKYHASNIIDSYPNGAPNRRNIEELIAELAQNNISLFCMKITESTNIMYKIFENIYLNYDKCEFRIVSMNSQQSLSNIVIDSAAEIYINQRNIE